MDQFSDEFTGVKNSVRKSRMGLLFFACGCLLGWILFWVEICDNQNVCAKVLS
jgi:hypothetical protein